MIKYLVGAYTVSDLQNNLFGTNNPQPNNGDLYSTGQQIQQVTNSWNFYNEYRVIYCLVLLLIICVLVVLTKLYVSKKKFEDSKKEESSKGNKDKKIEKSSGILEDLSTLYTATVEGISKRNDHFFTEEESDNVLFTEEPSQSKEDPILNMSKEDPIEEPLPNSEEFIDEPLPKREEPVNDSYKESHNPYSLRKPRGRRNV